MPEWNIAVMDNVFALNRECDMIKKYDGNEREKKIRSSNDSNPFQRCHLYSENCIRIKRRAGV